MKRAFQAAKRKMLLVCDTNIKTQPPFLQKNNQWQENNKNKVFLSINPDGTVHIIQYDNDRKAPEGWTIISSEESIYTCEKLPVMFNLVKGDKTLSVKTIDSTKEFTFDVDENIGVMLYNIKEDGTPNEEDKWFMQIKEFEEKYVVIN